MLARLFTALDRLAATYSAVRETVWVIRIILAHGRGKR